MATAAMSSVDWRNEWHEFEGVTYLNLAGQSPIPKVAIKALQEAIEWKKFPQRIPDTAFFDVPNRVRALIGKVIGAPAEEIALTTGASTGTAAVAYGLDWKAGDEVLTASGEFPLQYTTWKPMEEREGIKLRVVQPAGAFHTADDFIAALTPRTRLVSVSLVRFDNGVFLDAARLAAACHKQGTLLLLDASQGVGAVPFDVKTAGADFVVSAGYKWLLGPFGTGFFWAKREHIAKMRPGPFYWMAAEGADNFAAMAFAAPKPALAGRRWDAAETANYFNLAAMEAGLELVLRAGIEKIAEHNHALIEQLFARLPADRCVAASPRNRARRGPYGCFQARTPEKTKELYDRLREQNVILSLREGKIRVSPYLYNNERDIDQVIRIITA
ncbi:MAG TPA: aminotransferase class V-fold PLP-dependent enzyme [Dongiaceae bacterium]|nr:aminotransferase class V-fold PLP-dependent enzyme [Dongiaceae bacterium]